MDDPNNNEESVQGHPFKKKALNKTFLLIRIDFFKWNDNISGLKNTKSL